MSGLRGSLFSIDPCARGKAPEQLAPSRSRNSKMVGKAARKERSSWEKQELRAGCEVRHANALVGGSHVIGVGGEFAKAPRDTGEIVLLQRLFSFSSICF